MSGIQDNDGSLFCPDRIMSLCPDVSVLVCGFDSAWTSGNWGALTGVLLSATELRMVLDPVPCDFKEAGSLLEALERDMAPSYHVLTIDQPIIVNNSEGRRPVEAALAHLIGKYGGGVQPANRNRIGMFDDAAPIWSFLEKFKGCIDPRVRDSHRLVVEVYPALATLGLSLDFWQRGSLPKYNPTRSTFRSSDWATLTGLIHTRLVRIGLEELAAFVAGIRKRQRPSKLEQDKLDAVLCVLIGLNLVMGPLGGTVMIGDLDTGYIATPAHPELRERLSRGARSAGLTITDVGGAGAVWALAKNQDK